ncbi:two-component sensor histidine kinase, partial [Pseudomonas aeruginosa]
VLIVVLFSKALTLVYLMMNEDVIVDRQYSHGGALTIRAFWAADEESRGAIPKGYGLGGVPSRGAQPGEQHRADTAILQRP